jgi:hypothetical protein
MTRRTGRFDLALGRTTAFTASLRAATGDLGGAARVTDCIDRKETSRAMRFLLRPLARFPRFAARSTGRAIHAAHQVAFNTRIGARAAAGGAAYSAHGAVDRSADRAAHASTEQLRLRRRRKNQDSGCDAAGHQEFQFRHLILRFCASEALRTRRRFSSNVSDWWVFCKVS